MASGVHNKNHACLLYAAGDARYEEIPVPDLENHTRDVLANIQYTGICGTDVHFWKHGGITEMVRPGHPVTLGHEASGIIAATGRDVTKVSVGDRVAIEPGYPCNSCTFCRSGKYNLCSKMTFAAVPGPGPVIHGTLATYFRIPEDFCYKLEEGTELAEGALFEPLAVAVHACKLADIRPGQNVVVFGAGTIGLLSSAVAKEFGAGKITIVDINAERLQFALGFSVDDTYKVELGETSEACSTKLASQCNFVDGADVILEATGVASNIQTGIHVIKRGGSFIQIGMGVQTISFPIGLMGEKEITMRGCFRYGPGDFALASSLVSRKRIDLKRLISKIYAFEDASKAWNTAARGEGIKTLIKGPAAAALG